MVEKDDEDGGERRGCNQKTAIENVRRFDA
jgi:hypothetical protein